MAQTGMALKFKQMLPEIDNLLLKVERIAMIMMIILADKFEWSSIHDFTFSSMCCLELSRYRRLGIDASNLRYFRYFFWFERVWSWMLIFSYRSTTYWYTVVGSFMISTICRGCILKFMPPEGQQFQENRILSLNPRETKKREALEKMVLELQRVLFWMQRFGIFSFILLPRRFARASAPLFSISHVFYLICFELQLDINPRLPEHDLLFWIERLATAFIFMEPYKGITPYSLSSLLFLITNNGSIIAHFTNPKKGSTHTKSEEISGQRIQKLGQQKFSNTEYIFGETSVGEQSEKKKDKVEVHPPKEKLEVEQIAPIEENNKRDANKGEQSEKVIAKVEDDAPKENLDVEEESPKEEKSKWEEYWVEADDQLKEKSEVAEEAPKEENNNLQDDWGEADQQLKEKLEVDRRPAVKEEENGWEDWLLPELGRFINWEDVNIAYDNSNWGEELRQADEVSSFSDNGSEEIEDDLKATTAENARIDSEEVVEDIEAAERLKAENENLKREKKALEEKLISESLVYEDSRCVWETHNQKLNAMLHEAYLESEGLVKELENHCKLVKEMVVRLDGYEEDCRRWEQEKREISAKLEALIAASEKDKSIAQNCKENLRKEWEEEKTSLTQRLFAAYSACNYYSRVIKNYEQANLKAQTPASKKDQGVAQNCTEDHKIKWEDEKTALTQRLSEANSLCQYYYDVALHNAETALKLEEEKNTHLHDCEENRLRLTQRNADLAKKLHNETALASRFHNLVYKLDEKCWMLEDEKRNLTAKLCAATASSELYRSMLHDKGC